MMRRFATVMQPNAGRHVLPLLALMGLVAGLMGGAGCSDDEELILATTTSTQDSGLLDVLVPEFEDQEDYNVKVIAVGSGEAIRLGAEGEADVLLVHSPAAEQEFMDAGNGEERLLVMHNDFIIVGPADDPAGVTGAESAADAFTRIAVNEAVFLSRGDESGTHTKELSIWEDAGIEPSGSWYQETGQGMGATLNITTEKQGYTLSDRGTYLAQSDNLDLDVIYEGDPALNNVYHVIVVNPEAHSEVHAEGARAFARFMVASATQEIIREFGVDEFGEPLFFPDADVVEGATPAP